MALNSLSAMNSLRLSGLASGMDTESMVQSLMRAERMKLDKLVRQKTLMDWRKEANLEANNLLRAFRDDFLSLARPENYMLSASSVLLYKVDMAASSSITITAGKDAITGSHTVNAIASLASGAHADSAAPISTAALSLDSKLSDLALNTPLAFDAGELSFAINGRTFTFSGEDTLRTVINRVNADADAGVRMSYSSLTGKISVVNRALGAATSLAIENVKGNAFLAGGAAFGIEAGPYANGTDASVTIDGVAVTRNTNTFTIDGVTYALKGTADAAQAFTVEQNVDGAVAKVKQFVDAYNTLVTKLEGMLSETRNSSYQPLTDEERESMSDSQAEKWDKLAKSGMLRNDSHIRRLLQDLRRSFYDTVAGAGINASAIGIGTVSYLTGGVVQVNEAKLRQALVSNPQQVADAIGKFSASTVPATTYSESGLAARMQTAINNYIKDYQGYRTESENDLYDRLEDNMERMERMLAGREQRYWKQFSRMEEALSQMNAQSNWLAQQFAGRG